MRSTQQNLTGMEGESRKKVVQLALEIAESHPDQSVEQIIKTLRERVSGTAIPVEMVKEQLEAYRTERLKERAFVAVNRAREIAVKREILETADEFDFMIAAEKEFERRQKELEKELAQSTGDESGEKTGLTVEKELIVGFRTFTKPQENEVEEYDYANSTERLQPQFFVANRPKYNLVKSTVWEEISRANPNLSLNQSISLILNLIEEEEKEENPQNLKRLKQALYIRLIPDKQLALALNEQLFGQLQEQYDRSKNNWQFFGLNDAAGNFRSLLKEAPESPGKFFYEADYDGSTEAGGSGENFAGEKFTLPGFEEILKRLTANQIKLYNEMKEKGLAPALQLTPIAMSIRTLGEMIDAKREELIINTSDTFVWEEIKELDIEALKEQELLYDAENFEAIEDGYKLRVSRGKSKSAIIRENQGWVINFVATKQNFDEDEDKKAKTVKIGEITGEIGLSNAGKIAMYMKEAQEKGYTGLGYESYLTAQMEALRNGQPLDSSQYTILPNSTFTNYEIIASGYWCGDHVFLDNEIVDINNEYIRFRCSVRVN